MKETKIKTEDQEDKQAEQLDSLFLTLAEELGTTMVKESKEAHYNSSMTPTFHKASEPGQLSLLQLGAEISQRNWHRLRDSDDLDELAQTQTQNVNKGLASMVDEIETEEIIDSQKVKQEERNKAIKASYDSELNDLNGDHREHDNVIFKVLGEMDHDNNDHLNPNVVESTHENKQVKRLMEETDMDMALSHEEKEKKEPIHSPKNSLKSIMEEADMEETMKEVEGSSPPCDSLLMLES